jgi:hypothetical protein
VFPTFIVFFGLFPDKNAAFQIDNKTGSIENAAFPNEPEPDGIAFAEPVVSPATSLQQDFVFTFKPVSGAFAGVATATKNTPNLCADAPDASALCLFSTRNVVPVCRKWVDACPDTSGMDGRRVFCRARPLYFRWYRRF